MGTRLAVGTNLIDPRPGNGRCAHHVGTAFGKANSGAGQPSKRIETACLHLLTRGRKEIKHVAVSPTEKVVRPRTEGRASNEEVRKHLSIPTRFCGSWSSPGEPMETESILRTAGYRYHADWHRSDNEEEREVEISRHSSYSRKRARCDAKLPRRAVAIRTFSGRSSASAIVKREAA